MLANSDYRLPPFFVTLLATIGWLGVQKMSAQELANYLKQRLQELNMTTSAAAKQSNVSRQTWHKLLRAEINEAKLSTLIQVAETLETHPLSMMRIYFQEKPAEDNTTSDVGLQAFSCRFVDDITYPDNSIVKAGETFTKVWEVANQGSEAWIHWRLQCIDLHAPHNARYALMPEASVIHIPQTLPGEHVRLSMTFRAPKYPCTAISHWKSVNSHGEIMFPKLTGLYCMVKVITA